MTRGVGGCPVSNFSVWLRLSVRGSVSDVSRGETEASFDPALPAPARFLCCLASGLGEPKLVGGPHAADLELAIPAEYASATTPKHWRRPDARAGTPPYYVSPIADVPPTEV